MTSSAKSGLYGGSQAAEMYRLRDGPTLHRLEALAVGEAFELELFKNERYAPFTKAGFSGKHLLPGSTERGLFSHENGQPGPLSGGGYQPEPNNAELPMIVLPPGFEWQEPAEGWRLQPNGPADAAGYEYAINWPQGLGLVQWRGSDSRGLMVRRRRMVRNVIRTSIVTTSLPANSGSDCVQAAKVQPVVLKATVVQSASSTCSAGPSTSDTGELPTTMLGSSCLNLPGGDGGNEGTEILLENKAYIGLYFSAHWCPPCRSFTPKLCTWYKKHAARLGLEIVFVSSDKAECSYDEYRKIMPWPALPFHARTSQGALKRRFAIKGIPSLVILDRHGRLITTDGRAQLANDSGAKRFPWGKADTEASFASSVPVVAATVVNSKPTAPSSRTGSGEQGARQGGVAGEKGLKVAKAVGQYAAMGVGFSLGSRAVQAVLK